MVLPWGETTVIGQVVQVLQQAGVEDIVVVTGGDRQQVEQAIKDLPARAVFNPYYEQDEMVLSLQAGLSVLETNVSATLVALGDQPQVQVPVVKAVLAAYHETSAPLVIPSYQMRRGHPWLVARSLWDSILALEPGQTMRDVINRYADRICYLNVKTPSILRDLDTPEDYRRERPSPTDSDGSRDLF